MGGSFSGRTINSSTFVNVSDFLFQVAQGSISGYQSINQFGRNTDIDADTDPEDIWTYGGTYTYNDTPLIQYISSSDATDIGITITVEGLDENWNEQIVEVILNGQNQTQIGTTETFVRVYRAFTSGDTAFNGNVLIYDSTVVSVNLGVPSPITSIKAEIKQEDQQTFMTHYTVPANHTGFIIRKCLSLNDSQSSTVSVMDLRVREFGSVFRSNELDSIQNNGQSAIEYTFPAPFQIPEKSDVKLVCRETTSNNADITGYLNLIVVRNGS